LQTPALPERGHETTHSRPRPGGGDYLHAEGAPASPVGLRRAVAARIAHWGALRSTVLLTLASALGSVALTSLWLWAKGAQEVGDALYITLFVAVPMTAVGGGVCIMLVVTLEDMRRRLHELAMTDPLTGLRNRRHFVQWAQRELELAHRHDLPLALLVFDIDHFKRVNDTHGHLVGDQVLVEIGRRCNATLRNTDLLARWGGEEFIALLPNTPQALAQQLGERLRSAVSCAIEFPHAGSVQVTVSVGVIGRRLGAGPPASLDALIQAADHAMYQAKSQGRDRVNVWG
jgi:diguanylate cyclase (GGDEF)-like protein